MCTTRLATLVVRVDDPAVRRDGLGHLVSAARCGQPCAYVQELADAALAGQVAHGAAQERAIGSRPGDHLRAAGSDFRCGSTIRCEMIFTAQPNVIDPCRVRCEGVKAGIGGFLAIASPLAHRGVRADVTAGLTPSDHVEYLGGDRS
jgi:hypothetical protein